MSAAAVTFEEPLPSPPPPEPFDPQPISSPSDASPSPSTSPPQSPLASHPPPQTFAHPLLLPLSKTKSDEHLHLPFAPPPVRLDGPKAQERFRDSSSIFSDQCHSNQLGYLSSGLEPFRDQFLSIPDPVKTIEDHVLSGFFFLDYLRVDPARCSDCVLTSIDCGYYKSSTIVCYGNPSSATLLCILDFGLNEPPTTTCFLQRSPLKLSTNSLDATSAPLHVSLRLASSTSCSEPSTNTSSRLQSPPPISAPKIVGHGQREIKCDIFSVYSDPDSSYWLEFYCRMSNALSRCLWSPVSAEQINLPRLNAISSEPDPIRLRSEQQRGQGIYLTATKAPLTASVYPAGKKRGTKIVLRVLMDSTIWYDLQYMFNPVTFVKPFSLNIKFVGLFVTLKQSHGVKTTSIFDMIKSYISLCTWMVIVDPSKAVVAFARICIERY